MYIESIFKQLEIAADLQEYAIFSVCIAVFVIGFTSVCVSIIYPFGGYYFGGMPRMTFTEMIFAIFDFRFFSICFQCEFVLYTLTVMTFCIVLQIFKKLTTARAVAV